MVTNCDTQIIAQIRVAFQSGRKRFLVENRCALLKTIPERENAIRGPKRATVKTCSEVNVSPTPDHLR